MEYNFNDIEARWRQYWKEHETYKVETDSAKPKYYVLDMFPYPSGAGLHVGHPLGYIASDIYSRFKRLKGFNVLHPMGFDAFGLPAEQYAIQTGQHPAITTSENINRYREQLDRIGFSFDWSREVRTCDPDYYKWTQWIFLKLFNSWFNKKSNKAEYIESLFEEFNLKGNENIDAACDETDIFTAVQWKQFSEEEQQKILLNYRLAFLSEAIVNWCPAMGTVLANEEVKDGVSERGGFPVERKLMKQWSLRISAYADRLLDGLDTIDWSDSLKESQRNWIGKSEGAMVRFEVEGGDLKSSPVMASLRANPRKLQIKYFDEFGIYPNDDSASPPNPLSGGEGEFAPDLDSEVSSHNESNVEEELSNFDPETGEILRRWQTARLDKWPYLKEFGKSNRLNATPAEALLWSKLRNNQTGFKFRRQHAIGPFIVDFVCLSLKMIVEVDGEIHQFQKGKDSDRSLWLADNRYYLLRFTNDQVIKDTDEVMKIIISTLKKIASGKNILKQNLYDIQEHLSDLFKNSESSLELVDNSSSIIAFKCSNINETIDETESLKKDKDLDANYKTKVLSLGEDLGEAESPSGGNNKNANYKTKVLSLGEDLGEAESPSGDEKLKAQNESPTGGKKYIPVFTTRPDTIFGATFITLAPEHELVPVITTREYAKQVEEYIAYAKNRSERERMADVKKITGQFTGAYALHPFTGDKIPVWIGDYVLAGYGTGAVMAVPGHDSRDFAFAKHFSLEIKEVVKGGDLNIEAYEAKDGIVVNSSFLDGLIVKDAIRKAIEMIEKGGHGEKKINYRLRDAVFGRQRYWGEPIPIYYKNGMPYPLDEKDLPLVLPEIDKFLPTETGEPPLARAKNWKHEGKYEYEYTTMPGWAGSSWYFLRYMDPKNEKAFASKQALDYWREVDLYLGGSEHATGHLLYVRFWTKFLNDLGYIPISEPAKKLINQGMIQGVSCFVYRINGTKKFVSSGLKAKFDTTALHVDVNIVNNNVLDVDAFKNWRDEFIESEFILEDGKYICGYEVEKMSKSKWNVVSPDSIIEQYGADCLRMYEMFLGPLEQSKPWNTNGITGVSSFLRKFWKLFIRDGKWEVSNVSAEKSELKVLHKTIKKVTEDIDRFSFNTSVSTFMICVNELTDSKCNKHEILEPLVILISPYAPFIAEELWNRLGHNESVTTATFPEYNNSYLTENEFEYPVSVNGKTRFKITLPLDLTKEQVEETVTNSAEMAKWLDGNKPKKVIVVTGRIVNVVI